VLGPIQAGPYSGEPKIVGIAGCFHRNAQNEIAAPANQVYRASIARRSRKDPMPFLDKLHNWLASTHPATEPERTQPCDGAQLLEQLAPWTAREKETLEQALGVLARQLLARPGTAGARARATIATVIAQIDRQLSQQLSSILHHGDFQALEGTWRGLHHLVNNTETDEMLKIRVFPVSKKELHKTLRKFKGAAWDQSPIFKKVYEEEYGTFGGEPYGCMVGDYHFDHSPPDVELLGEMSKVCAAAHAPFIAGISPTVMQMDSWQELTNPRDLTKIFQTAEYAAWRSLRESEDSRYIGLAMPRFLARLPYGAKTDPVEEFDFEEDTEGADHQKYTWANSAYAMATNITKSFKMWGWCSRIRGFESGGGVEGLPTHTFPTDYDGVNRKCPTEIAITERWEAELAKNGFLPLLAIKNSDCAAFIGAQSLQKPTEYDDPDATANANLAAYLPYLFATCRFAQTIKCMVRDCLGAHVSSSDLQKWLQGWIDQYVLEGPHGGILDKARMPLSAAEILIEEIAGDPSHYRGLLRIQPHYQLEGLTAPIEIATELRPLC
jgi:type VI secretion system protein ImpC